MLEKFITEFLSSLSADGKSKCTIAAYSSDLNDFSEYFNSYIKKEINDIKYSDLRLWANNLEDRNLSPQSRARKISTLRSFFKYLSKMDYISGKNPADALELPKLPKKQPQVISTKDAKCMLDCAKYDNFDSDINFRNYTIVAMFLFTGIRREELTNITIDDVSMGNRTILIHGKGNKERTVYINDTLYDIIKKYLDKGRKEIKSANNSDYLFPSRKSEKLDVRSINRIVNHVMEEADIKKSGISAHVLRKRFATSVFSKTHDIATTSLLLGHSSPTVTMRYVAIDEKTMRHAAETVNF